MGDEYLDLRERNARRTVDLRERNAEVYVDLSKKKNNKISTESSNGDNGSNGNGHSSNGNGSSKNGNGYGSKITKNIKANFSKRYEEIKKSRKLAAIERANQRERYIKERAKLKTDNKLAMIRQRQENRITASKNAAKNRRIALSNAVKSLQKRGKRLKYKPPKISIKKRKKRKGKVQFGEFTGF